MKHFQKKRGDRHLALIGHREIEETKRELARAILAEGENESAARILEVLKTYKLKPGPVPKLAIRKGDKRDCRDMIVIRLGDEDEESTGIPAEGWSDPNDCPEAKAKLEAYEERERFRFRARTAGYEDIRCSEVLMRYLELIDPANLGKEALELREKISKEMNEASPWVYFRKCQDAADQLIEFLKSRPLGKVTRRLGKDYKAYKKKRPKRKGGKDESGKMIAALRDRSINAHLSVLVGAFGWFVDEFNPPRRIEIDMPPIEDEAGEPICLTWEEVQRVILWCLGFVWIKGEGFAREWRLVRGELKLAFRRLPYGDYKDRLCLIRFILIYFLTGTRFSAILALGWEPRNDRGWIEISSCWIFRNGRKSKRHKRKPREAGQMLPLARRMFACWHARDVARRASKSWTCADGGKLNYVVHDGAGNPIKLHVMKALVREAFDAVEIETSAHKSKHGGVSTFHEAGFALHAISFFFGTTEKTIDTSYRRLRRAENLGYYPGDAGERLPAPADRLRLPPPNPETLTFGKLVNPRGLNPPIRRTLQGPKPDAAALEPAA
ncbi:hypothetical protein JQ582_39315 [Bradyrhizobium japonicum]|uniref:hypothetical protein n=1 Tax=Bradyrhizobium japonicum TaxID=375 RepID=UPI001BA789E2|nr:hypothetical protein [Bradyrhizobium japonicum]MBR0749977.1 hypothetical protein [Bradyrhizobium japonicum]